MPNDFPDYKYKKEIWVYLDNSDIEDIVENRYEISTYGRIFDHKTNNIFPNENVSSTWYYMHFFRLNNGKRIAKNVHTLVVHKFMPMIPINATDIDHIDGIKYHNWIWNLDPVTHKENNHRASEMNLLLVGEDHPSTKISNDQANEICKLISLGYSNREICNILNNEIPDLSIRTVNDIRQKRSWNFISKKYDFSNAWVPPDKTNKLNEQDVRILCEVIESNQTKSAREIAELVGINTNNLSIKEQTNLFIKINRIRRKEIYKDIVKDYNF